MLTFVKDGNGVAIVDDQDKQLARLSFQEVGALVALFEPELEQLAGSSTDQLKRGIKEAVAAASA